MVNIVLLIAEEQPNVLVKKSCAMSAKKKPTSLGKHSRELRVVYSSVAKAVRQNGGIQNLKRRNTQTGKVAHMRIGE
jgi:hypothetical protein